MITITHYTYHRCPCGFVIIDQKGEIVRCPRCRELFND